MSDESYTGCVLCVHGVFIPGQHPQDVKCQKHGIVKERQECPDFKGQEIEFRDVEQTQGSFNRTV